MAPRGPTSANYFVRALAVVLGASIAHFALSHILLSLMTRGPGVGPGGAREAVNLIIAATAVAALAMFYLRTQYASPDHVTRSIPTVMRVVPPIAAGLFIPATFDAELLSGPGLETVGVLAPVITTTWASGFMVSILAKRLLHAIAIRMPPASLVGVLHTIEPPPLTSSFMRVLAAAAFSASLLAVGAVLGHGVGDLEISFTAQTLGPIAGLLIMTAVGAVAGISLGESPGSDVVSIARRLDALGYNARQTMAWPVVVTSFDEVGGLFAHLETLRQHLDGEMRIYQDALDKTQAADAVKSDFLSAVSHELRTPLNTVGGFAQLLLEGQPTPMTEPQVEDVRLILAGSHQLLELINDILDISMIESGELRLSFSRTDIAEVIDEVVRIHQPLVRDRELALEASLGPDLPVVLCDRRRIGQILTNLVSNAIKFTERGTITVRAAYDPRRDKVVIRVIDSGVGIAPDELESIFEEYRQAGSLGRRKRGTGLGLAIARSIATHHGGALTAESTFGHGSTFTLSLPREPPRRPSSIDMAEEAARAQVRAKRRTGETPRAGGVP